MKIKSFILFIAVLLSLLTFDTKQLFAQNSGIFEVQKIYDDEDPIIYYASTLYDAIYIDVSGATKIPKLIVTQKADYVTNWQNQSYIDGVSVNVEVVLNLDYRYKFNDGLNIYVQDKSLTINTNNISSNEDNYLYTQITNYATLNINGGTFKGGDVIIDNSSAGNLNITGGNFTSTITEQGYYDFYSTIKNDGTANISGGEFNLTGDIQTPDKEIWATIYSEGTTIIEGGKFTQSSTTPATFSPSTENILTAVYIDKETTTISGGSFDVSVEENKNYYCVNSSIYLKDGDLIIDDVTINSQKNGEEAGVYVDGGTATINDADIKANSAGIIVNNGTMYIKDGSFESTTSANSVGIDISGGEVNISGGKFKGAKNGLSAIVNGNDMVANIKLTGGEFEGGIWAVANNMANNSNSAILGANMLADGYAYFNSDEKQLYFTVDCTPTLETYSATEGQLGGENAKVYTNLKVLQEKKLVLTYLNDDNEVKYLDDNQLSNICLHGNFGDKVSDLTLLYLIDDKYYPITAYSRWINEVGIIDEQIEYDMYLWDSKETNCFVLFDNLSESLDVKYAPDNTVTFNIEVANDEVFKVLAQIPVKIDKTKIIVKPEDKTLTYGEKINLPDDITFPTYLTDGTKIEDVLPQDFLRNITYKVYKVEKDPSTGTETSKEVTVSVNTILEVGNYNIIFDFSKVKLDNYKIDTDKDIKCKLTVKPIEPEVVVSDAQTLPGATLYMYYNPLEGQSMPDLYLSAKYKEQHIDTDPTLTLTSEDKKITVTYNEVLSFFTFKAPEKAGEYTYKGVLDLGANYQKKTFEFTINVLENIFEDDVDPQKWYANEVILHPTYGRITEHGDQNTLEFLTVSKEGVNHIYYDIWDEYFNIILENQEITVKIDNSQPEVGEVNVYVKAGITIDGQQEHYVQIYGELNNPNLVPTRDLHQYIFLTGDTLMMNFTDFIQVEGKVIPGSGVDKVFYSWDNEDSYTEMLNSKLCIKERKNGILYVKAVDSVGISATYVYNLAFFEKSTFYGQSVQSDTLRTEPIYYCGNNIETIQIQISANGNTLNLDGTEDYEVTEKDDKFIITLTAEYLKTLVPNSEKNKLNLRINPLGINGWVNGNMGIEPVPYESQIMVIDIDVTYKIVPEKYEFSGPEYGACAGEKIVFDIKSVNQNYSTLFDSVSVFGIQEVDHVECEIPEVDGGTTAVPVIFKKRAEQLNLTFTDTVYLDYSFAFSESYNIRVYDDVWAINNHDNRFNSFQWYLNGKPMEGENKQFIYLEPYLVETNYGAIIYAMVQSNDGLLKVCPAKDQVLIGKKVGIVRTVTVYPNPTLANRQFSIELKNFGDDEYDKLKIDIYNSLGLLSKRINAVEPINNITLPSGFYTGTVLRNGKQVLTFKVIVK